MTRSSIALLLAVGLPISAAHAQRGLPPITANSRITFSFADPAPGKQLRLTVDPKGVGATFSYDSESPINFIIGSNDGSVATTVFQNVYVEMNVDIVPTGVPLGNSNSVIASVVGSFTIYAVSARGRADILHAELPGIGEPNGPLTPGGSLFLVGQGPLGPASGAIVSTSTAHTLRYTAGPLLSGVLDPLGISIAPVFDAVFTITDFTEDAPGQRGNGTTTASANTSFSGTAALIPTPGTTALLAVAGLVSLRRRR